MKRKKGARDMKLAPIKNVAADKTIVQRLPIVSEVFLAASDPIREHALRLPTNISR
ncbi:hypothetical protein L195_g007609 [Trifolium pratense]|uniref:Uncharacterized protein n=1 Tax=Trifolium pratense TaxID=57577 RepID=A0A2K3P6U5_TRIPR|nr:hypothetical protein L195_g007609 [Trifolium pratense]